MGGILSYFLGFIVMIFLVIMLNLSLAKKYNKEKRIYKWQHFMFGYFLIIYLVLALRDIVGFPSLSEWLRVISRGEFIFTLENLNIIPFVYGIERSGILNIIFFMPFGFLLPTLWDKYNKLSKTVLASFCFSLLIEISQLFTPYRASDINDLIMNTLGGMLGFLVYKLLSKVFKKLAKDSKVDSKMNNFFSDREDIVYIIIAIFVSFTF